jgi:integrase
VQLGVEGSPLAWRADRATCFYSEGASLPASAVTVLREHRHKLLEQRLALGSTKPDDETLLFGNPDGSIMPPNQLSGLWRSACKALGARRVNFHALRHTHVSALIAAGLDVVAISRRIGPTRPRHSTDMATSSRGMTARP